MKSPAAADGSATSAATERVLLVLEAVGAAKRDVSATETAERLRLPVPTVHRLLGTLARRGFVERSPGSKSYRLGLKVFELAGRALAHYDVRDIARPYLEELVASTGETVQLALLDGSQALYIDKIDGPQYLRISSFVGSRTPLHCTSTGKVLLAFQPEAFVDSLLADPLARYTDGTITDGRLLKNELQAIRESGVALSMSEWREHAGGIAAPLLRRGQIAAALGVAGPLDRIQPRSREITNLLRHAARAISSRLDLGGNQL